MLSADLCELRNLIELSVILGTFLEEFLGDDSVTGAQAIENLDLVVQRPSICLICAAATGPTRHGGWACPEKTIDR